MTEETEKPKDLNTPFKPVPHSGKIAAGAAATVIAAGLAPERTPLTPATADPSASPFTQLTPEQTGASSGEQVQPSGAVHSTEQTGVNSADSSASNYGVSGQEQEASTDIGSVNGHPQTSTVNIIKRVAIIAGSTVAVAGLVGVGLALAPNLFHKQVDGRDAINLPTTATVDLSTPEATVNGYITAICGADDTQSAVGYLAANRKTSAEASPLWKQEALNCAIDLSTVKIVSTTPNSETESVVRISYLLDGATETEDIKVTKEADGWKWDAIPAQISTKDAAEVTINGVPVDPANTYSVMPGTHAVVITFKDGGTLVETVNVGIGGEALLYED